jgi:Flp pilus assembly protein TadB
MTAAQWRFSMLTLGFLCAAFGVIYAFTPAGFSWGLSLIGVALMLPWLLRESADRRRARRSASVVPPWHPEYE